MAKSAKRTLDTAHLAIVVGVADSVLLLLTLWFTAVGANAAREALRRLERPYFFLSPIVVTAADGAHISVFQGATVLPPKRYVQFAIGFTIDNHGRVPGVARQVDMRFAFAGEVAAVSHWFGATENPNRVIKDRNGTDMVMDARAYDATQLERLSDMKTPVIVSGHLRYEDVGGDTYVRGFCFHWDRRMGAAAIREEGGYKYNFDQRTSSPSFLAKIARVWLMSIPTTEDLRRVFREK